MPAKHRTSTVCLLDVYMSTAIYGEYGGARMGHSTITPSPLRQMPVAATYRTADLRTFVVTLQEEHSAPLSPSSGCAYPSRCQVHRPVQRLRCCVATTSTRPSNRYIFLSLCHFKQSIRRYTQQLSGTRMKPSISIDLPGWCTLRRDPKENESDEVSGER